MKPIDPKALGLSYIASPYSKYPLGISQAFIDICKLTGKLIQCGLKVYSPIAHAHPCATYSRIDPTDHNVWLPFDEAMMSVCQTLIVAHMDGWQDSYGIVHEIKFFEAAKKPIFDLDPKTLSMTRRQHERPDRDRYEGLTDSQIREQTESFLSGNQGSGV